MKLSCITESVKIIYYEPENFDDTDLDPYDVADKAEKVAFDSGIRITRNKELKFVALDNSYSDPVIGGVWASIYYDSDIDATVYDFDVAVDKDFRGPEKIGLKLINMAINDYKSLDENRKCIKVFVINQKLARVLEKKYGFEIESYSNGCTHMIYY